MAYISNIADQTQSVLGGRISAALYQIDARLARRRLFRATLGELSMLSDRDLADLGLERSSLRRVAWQAACEG